MSALPSTNIIDQIATELNIDRIFLEKDWHASNVIKALAEFKHETFESIFCGGTSLMKGHRVIKRFSEDVDFRILNLNRNPSTRIERRNFRDDLIHHLSRIPELTFDINNLSKGDSSKFFSISASYSKRFGGHTSIRPELKLEGTFVESTLPGLEEKTITPLIGEYIKTDNTSIIRCLSLLETTADKSSALVWRILNRKRKKSDDDPSIIRHLYDLHELYSKFDSFDEIIKEAKIRYQKDKVRAKLKLPETFDHALAAVIDILKKDHLYKKEFDQYALNMYFGKKSPPSFTTALSTFSTLKNHL